MFSHLCRVTHMSLKLGVVMDPIESINYKKDTTLALLWAAQDRGWSLFYIEPDGLSLEGEVPMARSCPLRVYRDPSRWFEIGEADTARHCPILTSCSCAKIPPSIWNISIRPTYSSEPSERAPWS